MTAIQTVYWTPAFAESQCEWWDNEDEEMLRYSDLYEYFEARIHDDKDAFMAALVEGESRNVFGFNLRDGHDDEDHDAYEPTVKLRINLRQWWDTLSTTEKESLLG